MSESPRNFIDESEVFLIFFWNGVGGGLILWKKTHFENLWSKFRMTKTATQKSPHLVETRPPLKSPNPSFFFENLFSFSTFRISKSKQFWKFVGKSVFIKPFLYTSLKMKINTVGEGQLSEIILLQGKINPISISFYQILKNFAHENTKHRNFSLASLAGVLCVRSYERQVSYVSTCENNVKFEISQTKIPPDSLLKIFPKYTLLPQIRKTFPPKYSSKVFFARSVRGKDLICEETKKMISSEYLVLSKKLLIALPRVHPQFFLRCLHHHTWEGAFTTVFSGRVLRRF